MALTMTRKQNNTTAIDSAESPLANLRDVRKFREHLVDVNPSIFPGGL